MQYAGHYNATSYVFMIMFVVCACHLTYILTMRHTLLYTLHSIYHRPHIPKIDIGPLHAINVCDVTNVQCTGSIVCT
jgi:hypothetical protein